MKYAVVVWGRVFDATRVFATQRRTIRVISGGEIGPASRNHLLASIQMFLNRYCVQR